MSIAGIDVSKYQGAAGLDWPKAAARLGAHGFAYIRALDDDGLAPDPAFAVNWQNARLAGVVRGLYLPYYQTLPPGRQVIALLRACQTDFGELPPAVDLESGQAVWTAEQNKSLQWVLWILEHVSGRVPVVYTSANYWNTYVNPSPSGNPSGDNSWVNHYFLWVADWRGLSRAFPPAIPSSWQPPRSDFYQYSNQGKGADYGAASPTIDLSQFTGGDDAAFAALMRPKGDTTPGPIPISSSAIIHITNGKTSIDFSTDDTLTITSIPAPLPPPPPPDVPPPTAHPVPVFSATPASVVAGQPVTLSWSKTDGASGVHLKQGTASEQGVTGPGGSLVVTPTTWTDYVLRVTYPGEKDTYITQVVTVTPAPAPPPATRKAVLGVNCIKNGQVGQKSIDANVQSLSSTFNPQWAAEVKQAHPNILVGVRGLDQVKGYTPTVDQWWGSVWQGAVDGNYMIGLNEQDHGLGGDPDGIRKRIEWDKQALAKTKAEAAKKGITLFYCGGGFSTGVPDITNDAVIEAMAGYDVLMADPLFRFNQHLYQTGDGRPGLTPAGIRDLIFDESYTDLPAKRWVNGALQSFTERVPQRQWTVGRWRFYFSRCGWNPRNPGKIVGDECFLDVGSEGGIMAVLGCTDDWLMRAARATVAYQSAPLILDGVSYASPVEWVNIFQTGDTAWASYEIVSRLAVLQACQWGQA